MRQGDIYIQTALKTRFKNVSLITSVNCFINCPTSPFFKWSTSSNLMKRRYVIICGNNIFEQNDNFGRHYAYVHTTLTNTVTILAISRGPLLNIQFLE